MNKFYQHCDQQNQRDSLNFLPKNGLQYQINLNGQKSMQVNLKALESRDRVTSGFHKMKIDNLN